MFRATIASKGLNMTTVREVILCAVLEHESRFDVPALAKRCALPRSTVYRNMPLLVEARIVRRTFSRGYAASNKPPCDHQTYEVVFERSLHGHLVCEVCGRVLEVPCKPLDALRRDIATIHGFELDTFVHEMFGVCPECSTKNRP